MKIFLFALCFSVHIAAAPIGIICAHPNELGLLEEEMDVREVVEQGLRRYVRGTLWGKDTVIAICRIGKVAAATTATHMIETERVSALILIGVSGALDPALRQGFPQSRPH